MKWSENCHVATIHLLLNGACKPRDIQVRKCVFAVYPSTDLRKFNFIILYFYEDVLVFIEAVCAQRHLSLKELNILYSAVRPLQKKLATTWVQLTEREMECLRFAALFKYLQCTRNYRTRISSEAVKLSYEVLPCLKEANLESHSSSVESHSSDLDSSGAINNTTVNTMFVPHLFTVMYSNLYM